MGGVVGRVTARQRGGGGYTARQPIRDDGEVGIGMTVRVQPTTPTSYVRDVWVYCGEPTSTSTTTISRATMLLLWEEVPTIPPLLRTARLDAIPALDHIRLQANRSRSPV